MTKADIKNIPSVVSDTNRSLLQNVLTRYNQISVVSKLIKFNPEYANVKHWKVSDMGLLTNTWLKFYIDISKLTEAIAQIEEVNTTKTLGTLALKKANTIVEWLQEIVDKYTNEELEAGKYLAVTLDNVSVNISRTPTIIEHNVIGLDNSVKQFFSNNSYDVTITGLLAGGVSWQQDSDSITRLISILGAGFPVKISNPELDIIYGINSIVPFSYTFEQDSRGYHLKTFTLSCKSDDDSDLIIQTS